MRECLGCETYAKYAHTRTLRVCLMLVLVPQSSRSIFVPPQVSSWLQCRVRSCACVVACFARLRSARHGSRVLPVPGLYMGFCSPCWTTDTTAATADGSSTSSTLDVRFNVVGVLPGGRLSN